MKDIVSKFAAYTSGEHKVNTFGNEKPLNETIVNIINAVIGVLGLAAVVIIIIGGINYMMSSGEATKVKKARDTILYGVIGLVICVLAFAIVNFVIVNILKSGQ
ncbi:hypothetical protein IKE98_00860 [Candidatus Saccharibacteria bacterium]|nr:hypothetical protein [Candidatus Saccharibacteria bacterium]